jgi:hypothetical protein
MAKLSRSTKYSTYLFAIPFLWESLSRPFDLAGATSELDFLGEPGEWGEVDDLLAIAADWAAIGEDFRGALGGGVRQMEQEKQAFLALLAALLGKIAVRKHGSLRDKVTPPHL